MPERFSDTLLHASPVRVPTDGPLCLALAHNEAHLIPSFLDWYRRMGVAGFLIVDDRSTDGTAALLDAPDITVLRPAEGSTYAKDKRAWRGEILDAYGAGRWCLVPDLDERLIWHDFESRPLAALTASMGGEALIAAMVDCHRPGRLSDQVLEGDPVTEFDRFDDPARDPLAYRRFALPRRFRQKWPTPRTAVTGGMRGRLFFDLRPGLLGRLAHRGIGDPDAWAPPLKGGDLPPLNLTKVALLRWRRGARFYGGPHSVAPAFPLARETAVALHYPFTRGQAGVDAIVARGQHAGGSAYYKAVQAGGDPELSYAGTGRVRSSRDLDALFWRAR